MKLLQNKFADIAPITQTVFAITILSSVGNSFKYISNA